VHATQELPRELPHQPAPGMLVVEADGVQVRYCDRGPDGSPWHEVKLGIVGGWTGSRPDAHLQEPSYVAAREKAAPFTRRRGAERGARLGGRVGGEAARRGSLDVVGWRGRLRTVADTKPSCDPSSCSATERSGSGTKWRPASVANGPRSSIGGMVPSTCGTSA